MANPKFMYKGKYTKFLKVGIYSNTSCNTGCGCYELARHGFRRGSRWDLLCCLQNV